ncbi:hypothetical protein [Natrialba aegyptia]|uniref:Uncharacterized protein n=1 Tax=Natrialba aegyptia DSM 13077 TaxID=1227491 RepID=M0B5G4_9EURY|nr:hypothetical protein [Natrialba aegyptia]ELZ05777.1 hypothetical protein C480_10280 [Natrialba aegyptia DSM 13077]
MNTLALPDPTDHALREGATIVDCGDRATVEHVEQTDEVVYDLEFSDGDSGRLSGRELELGKIDGTIRVIR